VGVILGYLSLPIFVRLNDPLSSLLLTVALALGTFQIGQFLGYPVRWLWLSPDSFLAIWGFLAVRQPRIELRY
jgi:hypothetical protein